MIVDGVTVATIRPPTEDQIAETWAACKGGYDGDYIERGRYVSEETNRRAFKRTRAIRFNVVDPARVMRQSTN